ncbi:hypothetical protein VTN77DRAFT_3956 [Rasamsonia byssochlamydoides]|uniref:uncharacterized protein n=1 Tax=Rasamsonia byssochlamydoides TaxID=89139 RepID=UPI0037422C1F
MDSMRSLNTSLPSSTPYPQPPEQLLQAFKTAALSVTNLYKSAVADQAQARQTGYQEAIEDLLSFLDRENLGLGDGEGWKVRQWATERLDGTAATASDSDDDEKRARSSSPIMSRKEHPESDRSRQISRSTSPPRPELVPEQQQPPQPPQQPQQPPQQEQQSGMPTQIPPADESNIFARPPVFTFTAGPQFPQFPSQDIDMQTSDSASPNSASQGEAPVGVSVMPRNSRAPLRHNNPPRHTGRSSTREPSTTLGSKRKLQFPDFFDISGLNGREFFGGGKRGRFA